MRQLLTLGTVVLVALPAAAQQFVANTSAIPGTPRWSEGIEAADVDNDGDLDFFIADGDGFQSPGTKRQNKLIINNFIPSGVPSFTDDSVARLGSLNSHAKGVATGDVNGDGWVDALYCNAFNTDRPFLYINQGASNPGFFTEEGNTRGLTTVLASGGGQFGDLDDDGDLDLIITANYLGSGSGKPRLYFNDGTGNFTENAAALGAVNKSAHMDVQLVDVDNDWDLDFFGPCRAGNGGVQHYLMLNDGTGTFTDISSTLPSTSSNCYEAEMGDLDGDNDLDGFFLSFSNFGEGSIRNEQVPSGSLSYTGQGSLPGFVDDNEVALFDYDMDGDYDVFVGSLGNTEAIWRNDGSFSWSNQSSDIQSISDSTLDLAIADVNNDGRYDVVTVQGESNSAQWNNKVYANTGPADTLAPTLVAVEEPAMPTPAGPFKFRAKIRDQVYDDGVNYVAAKASYVINTGANTGSVDIQAGGFSPAVLNVSAGATVTFSNSSGANQSVTSTTTPYTYDSGILASGESYQQVFVAPGTYDISSTPSGATMQVIVSGTADMVDATYSGGGIYRFLLTDTAGGAGIELVYELVFTDWPGNQTVTNNGVISLLDCSVSNYCTAGTSAAGCQALLSSTGTPSVSSSSGFVVTASTVEGQKDGLFFYGFNGQQANSWGSGTSFQCVVPPVLRVGLMTGTGTVGACDGSFVTDFNAFWSTANPAKVPAVGQGVSLQLWYRDPQNTSNQTTSLSDGLSFQACP